jgi:hypothetical protein
MDKQNNNTISEAVSIAGSLGLDLEDIRALLPNFGDVPDEEVEKYLKHGKVMHRLNVSAKLYGIIESPKTLPRDLIAAERHLREVHTKTAAHTGSQELLALLHCTVPSVPLPGGGTYIEEDEDDEETL